MITKSRHVRLLNTCLWIAIVWFAFQVGVGDTLESSARGSLLAGAVIYTAGRAVNFFRRLEEEEDEERKK